MNSTVPTYQLGASITMLSLFMLLFVSIKAIGQTQAPSVTTGVTFQWADTQAANNDPATLSSITIDSEVFQSIAAPSSYAMTRLGPDGNNENYIIQNGTIVNNSSANADWATDAIAAFQDKNLNHYFTSNDNGRDICEDFTAIATTDAQIQSLFYSPGIPSNDGGIIAISERNANNCYYISINGVPAGGGPVQFLGDTFIRANSSQWGALFNPPPAGTDYWNSGRVVENGGTLGIAIFILEDLAPVGSVITSVDITASTIDHGDGKFFILQRYAKPLEESECMNEVFYGSVDGSHIPTGSTFSLVTAPTPAGQSFTFNADGSYVYTPSIGFTGDVVFDYNICLPAPNAATCDTSNVTITYESGPGTGCECNSGNADAPSLNN